MAFHHLSWDLVENFFILLPVYAQSLHSIENRKGRRHGFHVIVPGLLGRCELPSRLEKCKKSNTTRSALYKQLKPPHANQRLDALNKTLILVKTLNKWMATERLVLDIMVPTLSIAERRWRWAHESISLTELVISSVCAISHSVYLAASLAASTAGAASTNKYYTPLRNQCRTLPFASELADDERLKLQEAICSSWLNRWR